MTTSEMIPLNQEPQQNSRVNAILSGLLEKKNELTTTYRSAADTLKEIADILDAELSGDFAVRARELDTDYQAAVATREAAEKVEHETNEALQAATVVYEAASTAKDGFVQKGNQPFAYIAKADIVTPEEIDGVVEQYVQQLEALIALARGGKDARLHIFLQEYLTAKNDYYLKKQKHEEAERQLALAREDEAHFEGFVESLEAEAKQHITHINRFIKRAKTGQKHLKGERVHQRAYDSITAMGIMASLHSGRLELGLGQSARSEIES